jgi:hypothetical protein
MKIFEKPAATIAGTTSARLTTTSSATAVFAQQQPQALRLAAGLLECRGGLHGQGNAGERQIEFDHVDSPAADRGIVDVDVATVDTFEHHEMIEVPVDDAGHRQFVQRRRFLAKPPGVEVKGARRPNDVARLAAVARDAASDAELLQRDPDAVMGENHGERRGPALDGFHLQDGGCPPDVPAPEQPSKPVPKGRWPNRGRHSLLRRGVIHQYRSSA